jgi:predicted nucleic acid-binding protein
MDASSLILLGKCNLMDVLSKSFKLVIPGKVLDEVVNEEIIRQHPDANIIRELVQSKKIEVISLQKGRAKFPITLDEGETEAILLTRQIGNATFVTDDGKAIKACRYLKIPFTISPKVVIDLYRLGKIDIMDANHSINKLRMIGRYSPEIIADALIRLKEARDVETNNR